MEIPDSLKEFAVKVTDIIRWRPKPNAPCKNECGNLRRDGSAYCQACSDKFMGRVPVIAPKRKPGRPKGSKNKAKEAKLV